MKKIIALILLAIVLISPAVCLAQTGISQKALSVRENVFRIECDNSVYGLVSGSGFAFYSTNEHTYIATNYHVVENVVKNNLYIVSHNGARIQAKTVAYEENHDLAILEVNEEPLIGLDNLTLYDGEEDLVGIAVYVFGYPGAGDVLLDQEAYRVEDISITNGIVSAVKEATLLDKPTTYLQTNAAINAGNSGGPMINDAGEIVGICTLEILDSQGVFAAVSIEHLIALLEDNAIAYTATSTADAETPKDVGAEIILPAYAEGADRNITLNQGSDLTWIALIGVAVLAMAGLVFVLISPPLKTASLAQILKSRSKGLVEEKVGNYIFSILTQLNALHVLGKAHGNINPDNIFIDVHDNIYLGSKASKVNIIKNKEYLPPEMFDNPTPTTSSDIYSTGIVAYKMLTLANAPNMLHRLQESSNELIRSNEADENLSLLINSMAIVDNAKRPQSANELIPLFERYRTNEFNKKNFAIGSKNKWAITAALGILAVAFGIWGFMLLSNETRYHDAVLYIEAKDYQNAEASIQGIDNKYRETSTIQQLLDAEQKIKSGSYNDAFGIYDKIKSSNLEPYIKESQYEYAIELLKARKPQQAKEILEHIDNYEDAKTIIIECDYQIALEYLNQDKLDDAEQIFDGLAANNYRDTQDLLEQIDIRRIVLNLNDYEQEEITESWFTKTFALIDELTAIDNDKSKAAIDQCKDLIYRKARLVLDDFLDYINHLTIWARQDKLDEMNKHFDDEEWYSPKNIVKQFARLGGYADSSRYVVLCEIIGGGNSQTKFDRLAEMWDFTPVRSVIAGDAYLYYFFKDSWKGDGAYVDSSTGTFYTNIPWDKNGGLYWSDCVAYIVKSSEFYSEWTHKAFAINIIDLNNVQLYCFKNNKIYNLVRQ